MNATVLGSGTPGALGADGRFATGDAAAPAGLAEPAGCRIAMDRLTLLAAVLGELGLRAVVRRVGGYPVLYVTDPPAPWAVSVGAAHYWLGDPAEIIGPSNHVLDAAWAIARRLPARHDAVRVIPEVVA